MILAFASAMAQCTRANGPGGGHGGSGGHGSSGHAGQAGHSSGNSSGHSFDRIFAHHGKQSSASPTLDHNPKKFAASNQHAPFVSRRRHFGFSACTNNAFLPHHRFTRDCFGNGFFLDPFFFGSFSMLGAMPDPSSAYAVQSGPNEEALDAGNNPTSANADQVTLLQLLDGSMYGLTSYQVIGHNLHYTTTYGGQNSIPLDRIDFTQTLRLNAARQVPFVLEPKSTPH
jgi:hypothetical protein